MRSCCSSPNENRPRIRLIDWPASTVCSVLRTRWPVSAAMSATSTVARSRISPTRITFGAWRKRGAQTVRVIVEIVSELALVEGRPARRMNELDRIFESDDVDRLGLVDLVQNRGQRRRLAAAGRAGHENQAGFFLRDLVEESAASSSDSSVGMSPSSLRSTIEKWPCCRKIFTRKRASSASAVAAIAGAAGEIIVHQPAISLHQA